MPKNSPNRRPSCATPADVEWIDLHGDALVCGHWFTKADIVMAEVPGERRPDGLLTVDARRRIADMLTGDIHRRDERALADWRARNPGYSTAHRITQRNQDKDAEPLRTPPPLNRLPWDLAKDQFRGQGSDFIGVLGTLILRTAKDQFKTYIPDPKGLAGTLPAQPEKTRSVPAHTEPRAAPDAASGISSTGQPAGKPPGAASGTPAAADRIAG